MYTVLMVWDRKSLRLSEFKNLDEDCEGSKMKKNSGEIPQTGVLFYEAN